MAVDTEAHFTTAPLSGVLGAEVSGLDLSVALGGEVVADLRRAFVEHQVLVFRGQNLSPEQQIAFGAQFGELDTHPFVVANPDHPEAIEVITEADDVTNFGGGWHSDLTFLERPDLGSILYAVKPPPHGGDTLFASQFAAYDALSDTMKSMIDGLTAVHSAGPQYGDGGLSTQSKAMATKDADEAMKHTVEHPVVRTHPESGRKGLFVNQAFTVRIKGLRAPESAAMLQLLHGYATHESFTCRVQWDPGTLVMWDNRSVQHFALFDYRGHRRHMRRITIKGDRPT